MTDILSSLRFRPVAGAERLMTLHAAELPQKNELCGAFWGTLALRTAGILEADGPIDQDEVALAAGSVLSENPSDVLPDGEVGRADYRLSLPRVKDSASSGTSISGLVRALSKLSSGSVQATPVAGPWTPSTVRAVLDAAAACDEPCAVIANVATRHFWGSRTFPTAALSYLTSGDAKEGAPPDWDVGHFVGLLGRLDGSRGTLVLVADTYRVLGWNGLHLQPIECVAAALARTAPDAASGVLLVASAQNAPDVKHRLQTSSLEIAIWDNGTPDMVHAAR